MTLLRRIKIDSRRGERELERLVRRSRNVINSKTLRQARRIVNDVRRRGDRALLSAVAQHDGFEVGDVADLRMPLWRPDAGSHDFGEAFSQALEKAISAVDSFHSPQVRSGYEQESEGVWVQERREPLRRVGIYIR